MSRPLSQRATLLRPAESGTFSTQAPDVALRTWFAALGNRDNAPARIVCVGDSVTEGQGCSARPGTKRWIDALRVRLRNRYPTTGLGTGGGIGYVPLRYGGGTIASPWTFSGSLVDDNSNGLGLRARSMNSGSTATYPNIQGTSVDLLYLKASSSRVLSYAVDGGAATNLDTNGGAISDNGIQRITLGASGTHSLALAFVSGSAPYPEGVIVYDGDENSGIHVIDAGHHGYETTDFAAAAGNHGTRIASLNPQLVIISLGENDFLHNKTTTALKANLGSIISAIKSAQAIDPSFLLVANMAATHDTTPLAPWSDYAAAIRQAAADNGAAFLDMTARMPAIAGDQLSLYSDHYHPNDKGYGMFADPVLAAISPR